MQGSEECDRRWGWCEVHTFEGLYNDKILGDVWNNVITNYVDNFSSIRETRAGLFSYPADFDEGKGQLASSTLLQMQLNPEIVHIVGFCEANHAARPDDIIESTKIAKKVIENCIYGCPDMRSDSRVAERKKQLCEDARLILEKIKSSKNSKNFL